jgi:phage N-6-adenine-methyltransferase
LSVKREDAEEFTQSFVQIAGGVWRQRAWALKAGVPAALGMTDEEWVESIGPAVRLSVDERKEAAKELIDDGMSQRKAALAIGVDEKTIRNDISAEKSAASNDEPAKNGHIEKEAAEKSAADNNDQSGHHLARNTGNNEWYTPAEDIARARKVLGKIELDPASSDIAQETVKAERYYTKEQDGLAQEWGGNVWMNPPYAKGDIEPFVAKLVAEYLAGNVKAAIMLTNNSADTEWFHKAAAHATAICLTRGRIKFEDPNSDRAAPLQGQAFFYFGPHVKKFASMYATAGAVVVPYRG